MSAGLILAWLLFGAIVLSSFVVCVWEPVADWWHAWRARRRVRHIHGPLLHLYSETATNAVAELEPSPEYLDWLADNPDRTPIYDQLAAERVINESQYLWTVSTQRIPQSDEVADYQARSVEGRLSQGQFMADVLRLLDGDWETP